LRDGLLVKVKDGNVQKFSMSKWQAVIDTNLTGVFLCAREAAANFLELKKPGVIINIASVARSGNFGQSNY
ncbi:MAG TPA: short chain dehydrogenase, partial [Deltaproteobacteria bacterium]|nr:short chain dehydrogenase [Deltaproteobacteria bacterium]